MSTAPHEPSDFEKVCDRLGGFDPDFGTEWADGFLTGVLAGPRAVPEAEWLPALTGDAFERTFADPADEAWARKALVARFKEIARDLDPERLYDDPDSLHLSPLMMSWDDEARAEVVKEGALTAEEAEDTLVTGGGWAMGFLDAVQHFEADWQEPSALDMDASDAYHRALARVAALALDRAALTEHLAAEYEGKALTRDELIDEALFAVQDLRLFWVDHAPKPATRRVEAAPGRNDPCPCGSGKKYKKCCGAAA